MEPLRDEDTNDEGVEAQNGALEGLKTSGDTLRSRIRIRIRTEVRSRIRIRITVKSWMFIRNLGKFLHCSGYLTTRLPIM